MKTTSLQLKVVITDDALNAMRNLTKAFNELSRIMKDFNAKLENRIDLSLLFDEVDDDAK